MRAKPHQRRLAERDEAGEPDEDVQADDHDRQDHGAHDQAQFVAGR